jgi:hypothetical protein
MQRPWARSAPRATRKKDLSHRSTASDFAPSPPLATSDKSRQFSPCRRVAHSPTRLQQPYPHQTLCGSKDGFFIERGDHPSTRFALSLVAFGEVLKAFHRGALPCLQGRRSEAMPFRGRGTRPTPSEPRPTFAAEQTHIRRATGFVSGGGPKKGT